MELAGIEPVSENPLIQLSPQAVALLYFPYKNADRQAFSPVAFLCMVDTKANSQRMFTTDMTLGKGRRPPLRNGRYKATAALSEYQRLTASTLRQPKQLYCCRLLFKIGHFNGIIRPAALIVSQDPRRNQSAPYENEK